MARILYTSIPPGSRRPRKPAFVEAPSLSAAAAWLEAEGHREVRFHTDPNFHSVEGDDPVVALRGIEPEPGLAGRVKQPSFIVVVIAVIAAAWALALIAAGEWGAAIVPGVIALAGFWVWLPIRLHVAMRRAIATRAYRRAHGLLRALRFAVFGSPVGPPLRDVLVTEEARILAGAGEMERAKETLATLRARGPDGEKLFWMHLPSLYEHARDFQGRLAAARDLVARMPDDPNVQLDLAMCLALRIGDHAAAREALARAESLPMTELARAFGMWVEAIVLLAEGDPAGALARLDEVAQHPQLQPAAVSSVLALVGAFRARALAGVGRDEEAQRELRRVSPLLLEQHEHEILDASWAAVLGASPRP